jgi:hypothetical protein
MMAFLLHPMVLFAFGNLKRDLGLLWAWLCHRSFWQLTTMAPRKRSAWSSPKKRHSTH